MAAQSHPHQRRTYADWQASQPWRRRNGRLKPPQKLRALTRRWWHAPEIWQEGVSEIERRLSESREGETSLELVAHLIEATEQRGAEDCGPQQDALLRAASAALDAIATLPDCYRAHAWGRWRRMMREEGPGQATEWALTMIGGIEERRGEGIWLRAARDEEEIRALAEQRTRRHRRENPDDQTPIDILDRRHRIVLRREARQAREIIALDLGIIGGRPGEQPYSSVQGQVHRRAHLRRQRAWIDRTQIIDEANGVAIALRDIVPTRDQKTAEWWALACGLQESMERQGLIYGGFVLTLPPEYHPHPTGGARGRWNPDYLPVVAHRELGQRNSRARMRCHAMGIRWIGLRTSEAHQDECPHINLLLIADEDQLDVIEAHLAREYEDAPHGMTVMRYDALHVGERGAARFASYARKYFAKTLRAEDDELDPHDTWASTWGIRRHAWYGMPPVSWWRLARTLAAKGDALPVEERYQPLRRAVECARNKDAAGFIAACGGLGMPRHRRPIQPWHDEKTSDWGSVVRTTTGLRCRDLLLIARQPGRWKISAVRKNGVTDIDELTISPNFSKGGEGVEALPPPFNHTLTPRAPPL